MEPTPSYADAPTRKYATGDFGKQSLPGRRMTVPFPLCPPTTHAASCPATILDSDPSGSGLGVWVLVGTEPGYCIYEYAGGIS